MTTQTPAFAAPNLYQLSGGGRHVSFATSGFDGRAHLSYQDAHQTLSFAGDQIRQVETDLGLVVSVNLRTTVDQGSTSFTLLVPRVNLSNQQQMPVHTDAITTVHRFSLVPSLDVGQLDTYTFTRLQGTAAIVESVRAPA